MKDPEYPDTVRVESQKPRVVKLGWWHDFRMRKHNDFYDAHPEIWTESVDVKVPNEVRAAFKLQANEAFLTAMPEMAHISDLIEKHYGSVPPRDALEIACGIGRCSVYLRKRYGWGRTKFWMLDGTAPNENATWGVDEQGRDDFYNVLDSTKLYLEANDVRNYEILDARTYDVGSHEGTWDLAYSFLAFGFHWDLNFYLDKILPRMQSQSLIIFGMRGYDHSLKAREFTEKQISQLDSSRVKIVRDARVPERTKSSVIVLETR